MMSRTANRNQETQFTLKATKADDKHYTATHDIIGTAFSTGYLHVGVIFCEKLTICHEGSPCTRVNASVELWRKYLGCPREIYLALDAGTTLGSIDKK
jgi:hypothetical protein